MEIRHGFMEMTYNEEGVTECADPTCYRVVASGESCFVDVQEGGKLYCKLCGVCERYHRKKAAEREIIT